MDLVEIRKKAQEQAKNKSPHEPEESPVAAELLPTEEIAEDLQEYEMAMPAAIGAEPLQQLFPNLNFATEEDYIQGISRQDKSVEQDTVQWLTFELGHEEYALALDVILELIKPREYTDLPKVPSYVIGILSLRGEVVPVIDLGERLKLGRSVAQSHQRIIVCEGREQPIGLLVDRITQVIRIAKESIEQAPLILNEGEKDFIAGVGRFQGRMLIQLNPEEVLKL